MKKAVVTICIGSAYEEVAKVTEPRMIEYARKCGADFIKIDEASICTDKRAILPLNYEKYQLGELLSVYDRIIFFDLDCLVLANCPDLFEIVPEEKWGAYFYAHPGVENNIILANEKIGESSWKKDYFNSGVLVFSKQHAEAFDLSRGTFVHPIGDQTQLNYNVQALGFKTFNIGALFNYNRGLHPEFDKMPDVDTVFMNKKAWKNFAGYVVHVDLRFQNSKTKAAHLALWDKRLKDERQL